MWSRQSCRNWACCSRNDRDTALILDEFPVLLSLRSWPVFLCFNNLRVYTKNPQRISETYKNSIGYLLVSKTIYIFRVWNYSKISWLKLLWQSYFWNQFLFFSPQSRPWAISTSVPKYNKKPRQRNTVRDSGCPQITCNTDQEHIPNNRRPPGQSLMKLMFFFFFNLFQKTYWSESDIVFEEITLKLFKFYFQSSFTKA